MLLPGIYLPRSAGGLVPVTFSLVDNLAGVSSKTCNLGLSLATRKLIVFAGSDNTAASTCNINGVAATSFTQYNNGSERHCGYYLDIGVGVTSATVAIANNGATSARTVGAVYAVYGAALGAPANLYTDSANTNPTASIVLGAGSIGVGLVFHRTNSNLSYTPTGLTEELAYGLQNSTYDGSAISAITGGSKTVTPSSSGTRNPIMHIATFNPA